MENNLTVDWLKKNHYLIHYFGLGFIQIKVSDSERYHFYHPSFEAITEDPNDHRYDFVSTVLKGKIKNTIWQLDDTVSVALDCEIRWESCKKDMDSVPPSFAGKVTMAGIFVISEGDKYFLGRDTFHQVERVSPGPLVTKLVRGNVVKDLARVVLLSNKEPVCPFSVVMPEAKLWEIVEDSIK